MAILLGMLLIIGGFGYLVIKKNGYEWRYANLINSLSSVPWQNQKFVADLKINCSPSLRPLTNKEYDSTHYIANSSKPKFFIIDDSHALSLLYVATMYKHIDVVGLIRLRKLPFISYINGTSLNSLESNEWMKEQYKLNHKYLNEIIEFYDSIEYVIITAI